jgi:hypothetical protein
MGLNLHGIVRGAITGVAKDQPCELFIMSGKQVRDDRGGMMPVFKAPVTIRGQWQSLSPDTLQHLENVELATTVRRIYLYADTDRAKRPWAVWRPLGRSGDMVRDENGQLWRIDAVIEDFTHEGWVCVQATMQTSGVRMMVEEENGDIPNTGEDNKP